MSDAKLSSLHQSARRLLLAIDRVDTNDAAMLEFLQGVRHEAVEALKRNVFEPVTHVFGGRYAIETGLESYPDIAHAYHDFACIAKDL